MDPETIELLHWSSLTPAVNEIKSPNDFLKRLVFGLHDPQPTELIEIGVFVGDREVAPFVERDGEAIPVSGYGEVFQTVSAPNIRIKRNIRPSELMKRRRPATTIFQTGDGIMSAAERYVAQQTQRLADLITNAEEYLCALAIRGQIAYVSADEANFTITIPKPAGNTIVLTDFWDTVAGNPSVDVMTAKQVVSDEVGLGVTHAILGSEAMLAFMGNANVRAELDNRRLDSGALTLRSQFQDTGAIFLGDYAGVEWWGYPRKVKVGGSDVDLIRPKYAEFLSVTPAAENTLYYGAICDLDAFDGDEMQTERFAKSWTQPDPSVRQILATSRPLPIPRRPGSMVSMKVVSG